MGRGGGILDKERVTHVALSLKCISTDSLMVMR